MSHNNFVISPKIIIYEDEHILVLNKPSGIPVSSTGEKSLIDAVRIYLRQGGKPENELIHRIDKETSGVIIFGKNKDIEKRLYKMFRMKMVEKYYLALVSPPPPYSENSIDIRISHNLKDSFTKEPFHPKGKVAKTLYKVIGHCVEESLALCVLKLDTGRMHQIRLHLAWEGCPIAGDTKYGGCDFDFFGLHSLLIEFSHPKTMKKMKFKAPIPNSWLALNSWLQKAANDLNSPKSLFC